MAVPWFKRRSSVQEESMIDRENLIFGQDDEDGDEDEGASEDYDVLTSGTTLADNEVFHEGPVY